jgi:hypothetical protein
MEEPRTTSWRAGPNVNEAKALVPRSDEMVARRYQIRLHSASAATPQKQGAVRLRFRVACGSIVPGRAFVQARVQSMLAEIEADW